MDCGKGAAFLVLALELCFLQQARTLEDDRLFLLSLLPYPDDRNPPALDTGPSLFLAAELAVEHINSRSDILGDYRLELVRGDSGCDLSTKTVTSFVEHVLNGNEQIVGIIGPACSSSGEIIARLAGTDLLGLINVHIAGSALLSDRVKYPFSFGMLASNEVFADTLTALLVKNSWNRVATLYDESWLTAVEVSFVRKVSSLPGYAINIASMISDSNLSLRDIREASIRIIIVLLRAEFLRKMLCLAYHEDVHYPRYQFVIVGTVEELNDIQFQYDGMNYLCSKEDMVATLNGSIIIDYRLFPFNTTERTDTGLSYDAFVHLYTMFINERSVNDHSEDSLSPIFLASSYYDAVWSLAVSLNNSIKPLDEMNITLSQYRLGLSDATRVIQQQILELDFAGVSGRVHFNNRTGYVENRIVDIYQHRNGTADLVTYYDGNSITQISPVDFINSSFDINLIPARAPLPVAVIFLILIGVALFLVTTSHILSLVYRKKKAIRATQPKLNQLGYVGCYTFVIALLSYILAETFSFDSRTHCILYHMINTAVSIGSGFLLGTVCVKTWRIYKIFVSWKNPGKLISDSVLITFVLVFVVGDIVVCTLWIILDPFRLEERDRNEMGAEDNAEIVVRELCALKHYEIWFASLTAYNGLLLFVSLYLAYVCHHRIPREQREFRTNSIIILVYAVSVTISLGFAVYFIVPESVTFTLEFVILCTTLTLIEYYFLFFVFLPPIFQLWNQLRKQLNIDKFL